MLPAVPGASGVPKGDCPICGVGRGAACCVVTIATVVVATPTPDTLPGAAVGSTTTKIDVAVASGVAVSASVAATTDVACGVAVGVDAEYTSVAVAEPVTGAIPVAPGARVAGRCAGGTDGRFTRMGEVATGGAAGRAGAEAVGCGRTGSGGGMESREDGVTVAGGVLVGGCVAVAVASVGGVVATVARGTITPCVAPLLTGVFVTGAKDDAPPDGVFVTGAKGGEPPVGVFVTGEKGDAPG